MVNEINTTTTNATNISSITAASFRRMALEIRIILLAEALSVSDKIYNYL